ncbi:unnamed protein product, partial [Iphiclides podalirius]
MRPPEGGRPRCSAPSSCATGTFSLYTSRNGCTEAQRWMAIGHRDMKSKNIPVKANAVLHPGLRPGGEWVASSVPSGYTGAEMLDQG